MRALIIWLAATWRDWRDMRYAATGGLVADLIVTSLRDHPNQWVADRHRLANARMNIVVWVANEAYGLHVEAPARFTPAKRARRRIYAVYHRWAAMRAAAPFSPDAQAAA